MKSFGSGQGMPMKTKELAKQAVYFEAAKQLYEANALDDSLLAVRPAFPHQIDVFFKSLTSKAIPDEKEEVEIEEGEITVTDDDEPITVTLNDDPITVTLDDDPITVTLNDEAKVSPVQEDQTTNKTKVFESNPNKAWYEKKVRHNIQ